MMHHTVISLIINLWVVATIADVNGKLAIDCAKNSVTSVPLHHNNVTSI